MKWAFFVALGIAVFAMIGCTMPAKQMLTDDGKPIFVGPDGKATLEQTDPATNAPNEPLMETDVEKVEGIAEAAKSAGSKLPEPFGYIASGLIGLAAGAFIPSLRKKRDAARAKAKAELAAKPVTTTTT